MGRNFRATVTILILFADKEMFVIIICGATWVPVRSHHLPLPRDGTASHTWSVSWSHFRISETLRFFVQN
jgi:hypothetical protein